MEKHRFGTILVGVLGYRKKQPLAQKITLLYLIILLNILIFVPFFRIYTITDESVVYIGFKHTVLTKTTILFLIYCLFLIGRNASLRLRNGLYILFGFQGSKPLVTSIVLCVLMCHILVMSDVVILMREYISTNITMAWGYMLIICFLFFGILWQLMVARLEWKQKVIQQEVYIHKQTYTHKDGFHTNNTTAKTLF